MYIGTHATLPIAIISTIDIASIEFTKKYILPNKQLAWLALGGVLPDFLWPHFTMHQRLNSPTHTIWFLIMLLPLTYLVSKWVFKKDYIKFTLLFWLATLSHVLLDALSGGVSLFYPWGKVVGTYFIAHPNWIYFDIRFIIATIVLLCTRFLVKKKVLNNKRSNP